MRAAKSAWMVALLLLLTVLVVLWQRCAGHPQVDSIIQTLRKAETSGPEQLRLLKRLSQSNVPEAQDFLLELVRDPYVLFPWIQPHARERTVSMVTYYQVKAIELTKPEPTAPSLDALIGCLGNRNRGFYSETTALHEYCTSTDEVRFYALHRLTSITGLDCGYDQVRWRSAIKQQYGYNLDGKNGGTGSHSRCPSEELHFHGVVAPDNAIRR